MWIAGIDGARDGWAVVLQNLVNDRLDLKLISSLSDIRKPHWRPEIAAIDIPIGLPDEARKGGRKCDALARSILGHKRGTSVFSPPCLGALDIDSYEEAVEINRRSSDDMVGISKQSFNLLPKIREANDFALSGNSTLLYEVHPELSFATMNGGQPIIAGKNTAEGRSARNRLAFEQGFDLILNLMGQLPKHLHDDVLDAAALCWSARRIAKGTAVSLPPNAEPNSSGLAMAIRY